MRHPPQWFSGGEGEGGVLWVSDEHQRPLVHGSVSEGEEIVVIGHEAVPVCVCVCVFACVHVCVRVRVCACVCVYSVLDITTYQT